MSFLKRKRKSGVMTLMCVKELSAAIVTVLGNQEMIHDWNQSISINFWIKISLAYLITDIDPD